MKHSEKPEQQLARELAMMRKVVAELEKAETRCKQAQDELASLSRLDELILRSAGEGIIGLDSNGDVTFANPAAARMLGYKPKELIGCHSHSTWHYRKQNGAPYPEHECPIYAAYRDGEVHHGATEVFWRKDGTSFPVEYTSTPIRERDALVGAVVVFFDITERKRAEAERQRLLDEVQRHAAELDATITAIAEGVLVYSPEGDIVRMNPSAERIFRYSAKERQQPLPERLRALQIKTPDGRPLSPEQAPPARALKGEVVRGEIVVLHRPPDRAIWVSASGAPIRTADGRLLGAVVTITDITPLHELQEQREDILRAVSHDLRTPLTVAQGHAQLLQRQLQQAGLDGPAMRSAEAIINETRRMNEMIEELVSAVRLEAGQLEIKRKAVDLRAHLRELLAESAGAMDVARVKVDIPPGLPSVSADPSRLERIFINLLSNALKYSPAETEVLVAAKHSDREVAVSVKDRGVGISPEDVPHIFERFYRGKGPERREGLGLGLYITKKLVEANGGRIWVRTKPGKGSTFYFTLPSA